VNSYIYDGANRLTGVTDGVSVVSYAYNGLGDRLQTSAGGQTTRYTLDRVSGLTQVLDDGSYTYLYGNGRVAQYGASGGEYFLGDALGSVRQLVNGTGDVTLTQSYTPYGEILSSSGEAETSYAFTGEQFDKYTGLVYLRVRWYAPQDGRFTSKDVWQGDYTKPVSYNAWLYGYANPTRYFDPTGQSSEEYPYDLLYGIRMTGNWRPENKSFVRKAVGLVADKFARTLGISMMGLPSNNPQALIFMAVYGIHKGDTMNFEWDPKCYRCRPLACQEADLWENQDPGTCDCEATNTCDCKPTGGHTESPRWIKFASMWSSGYDNVDERRVNNVIHELGHAFNGRVSRIPENLVHDSPPPIENDPWRLEQKPEGFYNAEYGNQTWMQSVVPSGSETFADMFLGWVFDQWALDEYGDERSKFMNEHMGSWIRQALLKH
jgi:RHS repeat-associated protein